MLEERAYAPIEYYIDDGYPGRDAINQLRSWAWFKGAAMPVTWDQIIGSGHPLWYKPQPTSPDPAD
jgi:hypothetical protein